MDEADRKTGTYAAIIGAVIVIVLIVFWYF